MAAWPGFISLSRLSAIPPLTWHDTEGRKTSSLGHSESSFQSQQAGTQ